jgi:hypothetical protein
MSEPYRIQRQEMDLKAYAQSAKAMLKELMGKKARRKAALGEMIAAPS